jgi:hypothetical protein
MASVRQSMLCYVLPYISFSGDQWSPVSSHHCFFFYHRHPSFSRSLSRCFFLQLLSPFSILPACFVHCSVFCVHCPHCYPGEHSSHFEHLCFRLLILCASVFSALFFFFYFCWSLMQVCGPVCELFVVALSL